MGKVLTYSPSLNSNTFLEYTEKTIHTEHGKMYKIVTESGNSIIVTDDHSLATVGTVGFFSPLPPVEALGKFVPVISTVTYDTDFDPKCMTSLMSALIDDENFEVQDYMLSAPTDLIYPYIFCGMDRLNWEYKFKDEHDAVLMGLILARFSITHTIKDGVLQAYPNDQGSIPEDGVLVPREASRVTNVYRRLPYTWSVVTSVEEVEREETTYDFTVPEFPLFIGNNILVYDTMQVHVPITEEARIEALDKMLPSKNLFSARNLDPTMLPQQESVFGMFEASKPSKAKPVKITDLKRLHEDIDNDMIKPNDPVMYDGHLTTAGLALLNRTIPAEFRDYTSRWEKGTVSKILTKIGKKTPGIYTHVADDLKELGALFSYKMACSFKTSDFDLTHLKKVRDSHFAEVDKQLSAIDKSKDTEEDKYSNKVGVLRKAQTLNQELTAGATDNAFNQWAYSGSRGSKSQVMQIIASPTVVSDPRDRIIPIPIRTSYNEGLSPADYWVSSYGTRKGTVGAKLSVAPGGALAKEVIGNVLDVVITCKDCGTKDGIDYPINASHRIDIVERYEAGSNKFIDDRLYENLVRGGASHVKVRSPIKCHAQHGVCQRCFGHNEKGVLPDIGENIGVVAAQAVTEPLTQMGLSSKHTAGTAAEETVGLNTIKQFFTMPNTFAGAALVIENSGTISRIESGAAGGTDVYVDRKKYHAAPGRKLTVTLGQHVSAGDIISDGIPNLKKIVPHKGIDVGRQTFVDSAHDLYTRAGTRSIRKNFETIARGLVNYVKVEHPGDFDLLEGDVIDYNHIRSEISQHPEKKAPTLIPVQAGTTYAPQFKTDWLANFGFKYLKQNLIENAATGSKSEIHSYHPIPGYAAASEFGKGKDGRY